MPDVEGTLVRTATVDVHVVEVGTGDPVFLLHSNGLSWREGRGVMDQLSDSCRVLAWDMPGHGETAALPQTTVPDLAQVLIETVEALGLRDVKSCPRYQMSRGPDQLVRASRRTRDVGGGRLAEVSSACISPPGPCIACRWSVRGRY